MLIAKEILAAMENCDAGYYGIRCDDGVNYDVGDDLCVSAVYADGDATGVMLDGTCCIGIRYFSCESIEKSLKLIQNYYGDRLYLIGGDSYESGEDEGEYVIKNARVIAIIR